jgi:hypothetical protein
MPELDRILAFSKGDVKFIMREKCHLSIGQDIG